MRGLRVAALAACLGVWASQSQASVLVDASPTGSHYGGWSNKYYSQHFLVQVSFSDAVTLRGMTVYTADLFADLGAQVRTEVWSDTLGDPGSLLTMRGSVLDGKVPTSYVDNSFPIVGAHTTFADIALAAGTYWIGVSGLNDELGWSSFNDGGLKIRSDQSIIYPSMPPSPATNFYRLAFQLDDTVGPVVDLPTGVVPEPATWAMMIAGFGLVGSILRRRRAVAA